MTAATALWSMGLGSADEHEPTAPRASGKITSPKSTAASGWSIRTLASVGKLEVLCADAAALRELKTLAEAIPSSDIYPSFKPDLPYTLFFFDLRDEFVQWLQEYVATVPAGLAPREKTPSRRFGFRELATACTLLLAVSGIIAWAGPEISNEPPVAQVPPPEVREEPPIPEPVVAKDTELADTEIVITVTWDTKPSVDSRPAPPVRRATLGSLKVWFVDVRQGDGIILKLPNGSFVVIDANQGSGDQMAELLESLGCREIAAMVMTHPHADHLGGMEKILARFKVRRFYDPGVPHTTAGYRKLLLAVEKNRSDYIVPKTGEMLDWDRNLRVTVLNSGSQTMKGINNSSIVLRIEHGSIAMVFTGDAEKEAEAAIVSAFSGRLRADVLKVGHHGSHSSSTTGFLAQVRPKHAVISCGTGNTYGHPAPQTLKSLSAIGAKILRTDEVGTIIAESSGSSVTVTPASQRAAAR